ncbi:UNVERIFIED_CONTAM: hypothetical protein Sangu_3190600 [Sesamum angustifolium]|uniref:Uncharacterized protein n=1 Tax=Sesamum angustifolium TaxID=2727405 RepID=A0AAW2JM85_9LAMI
MFDASWASLATVKSPDELPSKIDHPDAAVAPRRYGLDPLLPALGHHSMSGIRGDILDVSTPLVGCAALPFDRYTVEEADHERYRCGSDPGQGRLRRRLAYG